MEQLRARPGPQHHRWPVHRHDDLIRDASHEDLERIRRVARTTWRATYANLLAPEWIESHLDEWYEPSLVGEQLAEARRGEGSHFLVADAAPASPDEAGEVIGYLHFQVMPDRGPYLRRLYVLPDHQGEGVGRALIGELHRRVGAGFEYELDVHPDNDSAVRFYMSMGATWTGGHIEPCWDLMRVRVPDP